MFLVPPTTRRVKTTLKSKNEGTRRQTKSDSRRVEYSFSLPFLIPCLDEIYRRKIGSESLSEEFSEQDEERR